VFVCGRASFYTPTDLCGALDLNVAVADAVLSPCYKYIEYVIKVKIGNLQYNITRRYSAFKALDSCLR
jgi:hypothetical protein